jgi:hypothetical protein
MGVHWVVGYYKLVGCYDHALHMRVVILGNVQRLVDVYLILIANSNEIDEKHPLEGLNSMEL